MNPYLKWASIITLTSLGVRFEYRVGLGFTAWFDGEYSTLSALLGRHGIEAWGGGGRTKDAYQQVKL